MARGIDVDDWQKRPQIKKLVNAAFPSYRRKKVVVIPATSVTLQQLAWDGGTRNEYRMTNLEGKIMPFHQIEGQQEPLFEGVNIIVQSGTFMGKPALCHIYVNPTDGPVLLPDVAYSHWQTKSV